MSSNSTTKAASSGTIELRYVEGRPEFRLTARRMFGFSEVRELPPMADAFERDVLDLIASVGTDGAAGAVKVAGFARGAFLEMYASGTAAVPDESFLAAFSKAARARGFRVK